MTILIDVDNTINNFGKVLLDNLNKQRGTKFDYSEINSYDWFDRIYVNPWEITESRAFWQEVGYDEFAKKSIKAWLKQEHQIYLVTASHLNSGFPFKIERLLKAFDGILDINNIIVAQNKSMIKGNILIDDCIGNLIYFPERKMCITQPWNTKYTSTHRFENWEEIYSKITKGEDAFA